MKYSLRSLMVVVAMVPPLVAGAYFLVQWFLAIQKIRHELGFH